MPVIEVKKPFGLRMSSKAEKRDFSVGRHTVSEEELAHWYMKACLSPKDGRAVLLADAEEENDNGLADQHIPCEAELMKVKVDDLKALATACGLEFEDKATKAELTALLLANQERLDLKRLPDGIFTFKAAE